MERPPRYHDDQDSLRDLSVELALITGVITSYLASA
jgi:hypothetical protein